MKNGYNILITLTNHLNKSYPLIEDLLKLSKSEFSKDERSTTVALGILNEFKDITSNLDDEIFILNKHLRDTLLPIVNYSNNLFNSYKLVNTFKLYDTLKIDLCNLRTFLNEINI